MRPDRVGLQWPGQHELARNVRTQLNQHVAAADECWSPRLFEHDFGDAFKKGDTGEITAAYGRWLVRPNAADEFGFNLATGIHAEVAGSDTLEDGSSAGNSWRLAGVHVTPIFTKGRAQYRIGVFVPLVRSGDEEMTDFPWEVRAGWEMFF